MCSPPVSGHKQLRVSSSKSGLDLLRPPLSQIRQCHYYWRWQIMMHFLSNPGGLAAALNNLQQLLNNEIHYCNAH